METVSCSFGVYTTIELRIFQLDVLILLFLVWHLQHRALYMLRDSMHIQGNYYI